MARVLTRFYEGIEAAEEILQDKKTPSLDDAVRSCAFMQKFEEAMNDDFNTAVALALLNEEVRKMNTLTQEQKSGPGDGEGLAIRLAGLKQAGNVLGLFYRTPKQFQSEMFQLKNRELHLDTEKIETLIAERNAARKDKDWGKADQCRDDLTAMGVVLEDTPQGTEWKIK